MARRPTGKVIEHESADGRTYRALRFTAYGRRRYVSLGTLSAGEAERELRHTMADVERGTWQPPAAASPPSNPAPMPTFHQFAEQWWLRHEKQITAGTRADYRRRLERHLIPFFGEMHLDRITFDTVERYIANKLAEDRPLSPRSINMTVTLLAAILERAVERELIARNPAKGKGRRVRERVPRRSYLETAGQITALLDAAGELDHEAASNRRHVARRAMLMTLTFAGLRISELLALRWRDVDVESGWLTVGESKTDAGRRRVKLRGALRHELSTLRADGSMKPEGLVFPTATGRTMSAENFRKRVLAAAVNRANENLAEAKRTPLPDGLTPHSLRRTFASLLYALGEDPGVVMDEVGHTDPGLALRIYRQAMRRGDEEKQQLRALVEGTESERRRTGKHRHESPGEAPKTEQLALRLA